MILGQKFLFYLRYGKLNNMYVEKIYFYSQNKVFMSTLMISLIEFRLCNSQIKKNLKKCKIITFINKHFGVCFAVVLCFDYFVSLSGGFILFLPSIVLIFFSSNNILVLGRKYMAGFIFSMLCIVFYYLSVCLFLF